MYFYFRVIKIFLGKSDQYDDSSRARDFFFRVEYAPDNKTFLGKFAEPRGLRNHVIFTFEY